MNNLGLLQDWLKSSSVHGVLVPSTDAYLSEWTPAQDRRLQWATGYSGSMGQAIILQDGAGVFVDSRYTRQAREERISDSIKIMESSYAAIKFPLQDQSILGWIAAHFEQGDKIAVDPTLSPFLDVFTFLHWAERRGIEVALIPSPIDDLWQDQTARERAFIYQYPLEYSGKSVEEKCEAVRRELQDKNLDVYLVSDPEDVSWLLNVRADDWPNTPVCLSTALVSNTGEVTWFVDGDRLKHDLRESLPGEILVVNPHSMEQVVRKQCRGKSIAANLSRTTYRIGALASNGLDLPGDGTCLTDDAMIERMRWSKNSIELVGARRAHQIDGIAIIRLMAWLDDSINHMKVTELDAVEKLCSFRAQRDEFRGLSFPIMLASGANSALPHYNPTAETNRALNDHPIFWLDSGGQYFGGTTDNTIVMALGTPTHEHITAHTLVLKGLICLASARFPYGTTGAQLDTLARQYLWKKALDYGHGTGHGVGNFLNVHETVKIAGFSSQRIEEGMIVSDEPAFYLNDDFGIRLERILATVKSDCEGFLEFELLSFLPIDHRLVDFSLLNSEEIEWLDVYHQKIAEMYKGDLDDKTNMWLMNVIEIYRNLAEQK